MLKSIRYRVPKGSPRFALHIVRLCTLDQLHSQSNSHSLRGKKAHVILGRVPYEDGFLWQDIPHGANVQQTLRARLVCVAALASDGRVERQVRYEVILMEVVHAGAQVAGDEPARESPGI